MRPHLTVDDAEGFEPDIIPAQDLNKPFHRDPLVARKQEARMQLVLVRVLRCLDVACGCTYIAGSDPVQTLSFRDLCFRLVYGDDQVTVLHANPIFRLHGRLQVSAIELP